VTARLEAAVTELVAALRAEIGARAAGGPPELLSIASAAQRMSIGRTAMYDAIGRGELRSVKVGRRRLIPADAIAELTQRETDPAATEPAQEAPHGRDAAPPTAAA